MFEVQDLRYATLATVSRCGMVWFSEDVLSTEMIFDNNLLRMKRVPIEEFEEETRRIKARGEEENALSPAMQVWKIKALYEGEILIPFPSLNSQPKEPFCVCVFFILNHVQMIFSVKAKRIFVGCTN